ncbi:transketolase [Sesbania bispinosa]|nr:transketolase [Sesbania bispinosa]
MTLNPSLLILVLSSKALENATSGRERRRYLGSKPKAYSTSVVEGEVLEDVLEIREGGFGSFVYDFLKVKPFLVATLENMLDYWVGRKHFDRI